MAEHPISPHSRLLQKFDTCRTAFMLCDVQERVEPHIRNFYDAVHVANAFSAVHQLLGSEYSVFIASEQYPKGLGHVHHAVKLPPDAIVAEKLTPSMLVPKVQPYIFGDAERGIPPVQQVVIWGHETYGCLLQTTDELRARGIRVAIAVDGCATQKPYFHDVAILQMSHWPGVNLSTVTAAVMQLTRSDPRFLKDSIKVFKNYFADWHVSHPQLEMSPVEEAEKWEREKAKPVDGTQQNGDCAWMGMEK